MYFAESTRVTRVKIDISVLPALLPKNHYAKDTPVQEPVRTCSLTLALRDGAISQQERFNLHDNLNKLLDGLITSKDVADVPAATGTD